MKLFLVTILMLNTLYALDGMKNITLQTLDRDEVNYKIVQRMKSVKLTNLTKVDYKVHQKNIQELQEDIFKVLETKDAIHQSQNKLKEQQTFYNEHNASYQTKLQDIYRSVKNIHRESFYIVTHKLDQDYKQELQNMLVDKYGVTKFEQSMKLTENDNGSSSFSNVIKTTKEFGEMQIEVLKDFTFREKNLNFKLVKVVQYPFVQAKTSLQNKVQKSEIDKFAEDSGIKIYQLSTNQFNYKDVVESYDINKSEKQDISTEVGAFIDLQKVSKNFTHSSKNIENAVQKIEKFHDTELALLNKYANLINGLNSTLKDEELDLKQNIEKMQALAKEYSLELNVDDLDKLIIVTPKIYEENVDLGEEKEFIARKAKSYLSKVTINNLSQSETLKNYVDLRTTNSDVKKMIEYNSIHLLPFVEGKKLAVFMFAVIEVKEKVTQSNYVTKQFKYGKIEFVPINRGYTTLFAANTELTIGIIKEFLETHRQNKYFDEYCLEDSFLPPEAKDMKNVAPEFYNYPAICMKIDKIEDIMKWLSQKTQKELMIPRVVDWSYVASNANSTSYCWGNETLEELKEDEQTPENIYYEDEKDTTIEPVAQHKASLMGMYDMCGNVHELVKDGEVFMVKGNSFISYIEKSDAPAMDYGYDLSPALGLRLFYKSGE